MRDIQYFLAVAQAGRLSAAAADQGVTQPAVTKAIRRVEQEFGLQLFERSPRGMALTSSGLAVADPLRRLQCSYADAMLFANDMRSRQVGLLRVGVTDTTAGGRLAQVLGPLIAKRPALRVQMRVDRSDVLAALVRSGELDLAIVPVYEGQPLEGERTAIDNDPMLPLVRAQHPLALRASVALADVVDYGWLLAPIQSASYRALADVFTRHKLEAPRVVMEAPFASGLNLDVLAATDLIALVPNSSRRRAQDDRFAVLPIAALRIPRTVVLLSRPGSAWSPLMTVLRDNLLHLSRTRRAGS